MATTELKPPTKPVPDWEAVRDAWVRDVETLIAEVSGWCQAERWATRIVPRRLWDPRVGGHVVPGLLLQVEFTELSLEPVYPSVAEEGGLIDLYLMPRYDDIASIVREPSGWRIHAGRDWNDRGDVLSVPGRTFDREAFVETVNRMVADKPSSSDCPRSGD